MASIAQGLIQGLATGFQGDVLATDLLKQKTELTEQQRKLKQEQASDKAGTIWSKAITDLLSAQQTQPTQPIAPQPGQASVPGQGAGPPATPTAPGLGGGAPPAAAASPAAATLGTLGQTAVPQAPPPIADPMNAASILAKIKADNPNLDAGVLSSVVNDYMLPYLSQQQQNNYKHFQEQLDWQKFTAGEQDKANTLYWRLLQLDDMMQRFGMTTQLKEQATAAKQGLAQIRQKHVEAGQAAKADKKAKEGAAAGKAVKLPQALQVELQTLNKRQGWLDAQIKQARDLGQLSRVPGLEKQRDDVQKRVDDLLAKAEQLDAQGAPQQPTPAQGSGDPAKAGQSETTVPADKPVDGITPEVWGTLKPAQKKIFRDLSEGTISKEEAKKRLDALTTGQ